MAGEAVQYPNSEDSEVVIGHHIHPHNFYYNAPHYLSLLEFPSVKEEEEEDPLVLGRSTCFVAHSTSPVRSRVDVSAAPPSYTMDDGAFGSPLLLMNVGYYYPHPHCLLKKTKRIMPPDLQKLVASNSLSYNKGDVGWPRSSPRYLASATDRDEPTQEVGEEVLATRYDNGKQ